MVLDSVILLPRQPDMAATATLVAVRVTRSRREVPVRSITATRSREARWATTAARWATGSYFGMVASTSVMNLHSSNLSSSTVQPSRTITALRDGIIATT